tara:strand:+ start:93 stop:362 length:270 start_codon:yes stop_codon:yes gene_type:complete
MIFVKKKKNVTSRENSKIRKMIKNREDDNVVKFLKEKLLNIDSFELKSTTKDDRIWIQELFLESFNISIYSKEKKGTGQRVLYIENEKK